ncbi:O-antigen ligase family protein [Amorphus sp. 3PC139-8]|uniref:O-antigen ligase family protein n=1 Tax=Amorphus sp. 3PC139-8 TaxID=2735676 RepID=UPI00345D3B93
MAALSFGALTSLLLLTIAISLSRSGVLLGTLALVVSAFMFRSNIPAGDQKKVRLAVIGAGLLAALLIANYALLGLVNRIATTSAVDDYRSVMWSVTADGLVSLLPFGAGFGTFIPVYRWFEQPTDLSSTWANRAHNDYLELGLEGGLPALILIGVFVWWYGRTAYRLWRGDQDQRAQLDVNLARAASISIGLLLLHSFADYPMRTLAIQAVFALLCAFLVPPICRPDGTVLKRRRKKKRPRTSPGKGQGRPPQKPSREPPPNRPSTHGPGSSVVWTD